MMSSFFPGQEGRGGGGCKQQGAGKQATGEQQLGDDAFQKKEKNTAWYRWQWYAGKQKHLLELHLLELLPDPPLS